MQICKNTLTDIEHFGDKEIAAEIVDLRLEVKELRAAVSAREASVLVHREEALRAEELLLHALANSGTLYVAHTNTK